MKLPAWTKTVFGIISGIIIAIIFCRTMLYINPYSCRVYYRGAHSVLSLEKVKKRNVQNNSYHAIRINGNGDSYYNLSYSSGRVIDMKAAGQ